ncbi:MAG: Hsp33 family molecular chaperone HslO [Geminicoccaceae bacterium]
MSQTDDPSATADDLSLPFQLESTGLRGRIVRMGDSIDAILGAHDYPEPVSRRLAELLVLAATLSGNLKFNGRFSLQARGNGPVSMLLADCTHDGRMRGYARFDAEKVDALEDTSAVPDLLGAGYLVLAVDQGPERDQYQGMVELAGESLKDCMLAYFRRSEQVQTGLTVAVERTGEGWRGGGILVQRMPDPSATPERDAIEDWRRTMMLLGSATANEVLAPGLSAERLLFRLFHEEGVRVYERLDLSFGCRCNEKRVRDMLAMFSPAELDDMRLEDGSIAVTCEFCGAGYTFNEAEIDALRATKLH